jgi:iron-sulfur cluster assembly accessory protein
MGETLLGYGFVISFTPSKSFELNSSMITLTDSARDYLKSVANGDYVSLGVKGGGCSGFQYVWDFASKWPDTKWSDPIENVLVLDPMAELYILGSTIDYVEELGGSYLSIKNPTSTSSCGCGESFGV